MIGRRWLNYSMNMAVMRIESVRWGDKIPSVGLNADAEQLWILEALSFASQANIIATLMESTGELPHKKGFVPYNNYMRSIQQALVLMDRDKVSVVEALNVVPKCRSRTDMVFDPDISNIPIEITAYDSDNPVVFNSPPDTAGTEKYEYTYMRNLNAGHKQRRTDDKVLCPDCGLFQSVVYDTESNDYDFTFHDCRPMREVLEAQIKGLRELIAENSKDKESPVVSATPIADLMQRSNKWLAAELFSYLMSNPQEPQLDNLCRAIFVRLESIG